VSLLSLIPDSVASASENLESLGSALHTANTAAASQTTAIVAPAADEVSAAVTALFGTHAQEFQTLSAEAAAFHEGFVKLLNGGAAQYVSTEVANARQTLVNASVETGHTANPAANSAQAAVGIVKNYHLGPLELSLSQFTAPLAGGGTGQAVNALVSLNTPLGRAGLWSAGGSTAQTANAGSAVGYVSTPIGPLELSLGATNVPLTGGGFQATLQAATFLSTPLGHLGLFGPLEVSASGTPLSLTNNVFHGAWSANATLSTPVGPVGLLSAAATANIPANGPVLLAADGIVPGLGHLELSVLGTASGGSTVQFTGATLSAPAAISLLAAQAGPLVTGGAEIVNNTIGVVGALSTGNLAGAASLYFSSPIAFADAVLFGQDTVNIPLGSGPSAVGLHIPFGGVFAPLRPISVTVPTSTYTDSSTNTTLTVLGSEFSVQGTEFGGIVPTFLNLLAHSL